MEPAPCGVPGHVIDAYGHEIVEGRYLTLSVPIQVDEDTGEVISEVHMLPVHVVEGWHSTLREPDA